MERRIVLNPPELISFKSLGEKETCVLSARNNWDRAVIFKMKTTRPTLFKMRPVFGTIEPKQEKRIKLVFKGSQKPLGMKDRFTVVLASAPPNCKDAAQVWRQNTAPEVQKNTVRRILKIRIEDNTVKPPKKPSGESEKLDEGVRQLKKHEKPVEGEKAPLEKKASDEKIEEKKDDIKLSGEKLSAERPRTPRKQSAEVMEPPPPPYTKDVKRPDEDAKTAVGGKFDVSDGPKTAIADDNAPKTAVPGNFGDDGNAVCTVPSGTAISPIVHATQQSSSSSSCSCSSPDPNDPEVIAERAEEEAAEKEGK